MGPISKVMLRGGATIVLACGLATLAQAQRGSRSGGPLPTRETSMMTDLERDMNQRRLESKLGRPVRRREKQLSFEQISQDFTRIQVINNDLVRAAMRSDELDLKFVTQSTAEIRKLAARLKENLVLPEPEENSKRTLPELGQEAEQLKPALTALGKLIAGFAHNPVFQQPEIVDAQMSAKARRDLEEIIELSGQLKKTSEKLSKTARK